MKKLKLALIVVTVLLIWQTCVASGRSIDFVRPHSSSSDLWTPAGDSVIYRPAIIQSRKSFLAEYPSRREIPHFALEEFWTADSPHVATVRRGGVVQTHTPGWAWFTLRVRGLKTRLRVRVELPMDSVVMRFPVRQAHVGDTVELFYRRYYADGLEEGGYQWEADTKDRDRNGVPIGQHVLTPVTIQGSGAEGDTIRFWLRRPGIFRVRSVTHGRPLEDSIRVLPGGERSSRLIRSDWGTGPQPRPRSRRPFRCYMLSFADFKAVGYVEDQSGYAFLPRLVELDSNLIVRNRPDLGMRINAYAGERIEIRRDWRFIGDSIRMFFETRENVIPHHRVEVLIPSEPGTVLGRAEQSTSTASVEAQAIQCP